MTSALRWAAMGTILMFYNCEGAKVTRQCPQTTTFEDKGEPKQIRTEVLLFQYQPNALPLGQIGSRGLRAAASSDKHGRAGE